MIVKKLYRKVRCKWWNDNRKVYELTTVNDYMGWFLFGFIHQASTPDTTVLPVIHKPLPTGHWA